MSKLENGSVSRWPTSPASELKSLYEKLKARARADVDNASRTFEDWYLEELGLAISFRDRSVVPGDIKAVRLGSESVIVAHQASAGRMFKSMLSIDEAIVLGDECETSGVSVWAAELRAAADKLEAKLGQGTAR
jgi:hypothetical protein